MPQIEVAVDVYHHPAASGEFELARSLAVAVEHRPRGIETSSTCQLELVSADQDRTGPQFAQMLEQGQVAVGLERVRNNGRYAVQRRRVGLVVVRQRSEAVEIKRSFRDSFQNVFYPQRLAAKKLIFVIETHTPRPSSIDIPETL